MHWFKFSFNFIGIEPELLLWEGEGAWIIPSGMGHYLMSPQTLEHLLLNM